MSRKTFSQVLRDAMERKNLTANQLQEDTKVPWATLSDWLGKDVRPTISKSFKKVVIYLELTLEEILEIA